MSPLFSPLTPLGFAVLLLRDRLARARSADDAGTAVEWVVITAMLVVIAGGVFTVLYQKIHTAANNVNLNQPAAPGP